MWFPPRRPNLVCQCCLLLIAFLCFPAGSRAQLGESRQAILKYYGPVVRSHARVREHQILEGTATDGDVHEKSGCYVRVVYGQGLAVQLEFSKKEGILRADEVDKLLAANADNSKWEPGNNSSRAIRFYRRLDGSAVASWTTDFHGSLLISAEQTDQTMQKLLSASESTYP